jgi:polyhydroxyalkanoate synthesis regulator phasin
MTLKRTISILAVGALAIAAAIGIVAYRSAAAAVPAAATVPGNVFAHLGFGRGFGGGYTGEDLADALGISVDELTTAYEAANNAALDQAVEAGLLTEAQADQLRANGSAFPFGGRWGGWLEQNGIDFDALLADALGISVDELQAAYAEAHNARIDQAVADGRITQEQAELMKARYVLFSSESFRTSMQTAFEDAVSQAVADGVITQDQADAILESGAGLGFHGFGGFGGFGGRGFGRHGWWGNGAPGDPGNPESPAVTPSDGL